jgi:IS4 transposase
VTVRYPRRSAEPRSAQAFLLGARRREMECLTNNLQLSPTSVADLYRCRWQIEVFLKQIKQSLQLCDLLGNSANAVRWQVWTAH